MLEHESLHRSRMIEIDDRAKQLVQEGRIEANIREHFTEEYVAQIAKKFDFPASIRPHLLEIAQFLHLASEGYSWPKPSDVKDELKALQNNADALRERLENLSVDAEYVMGQMFEVPIEGTGATEDEKKTTWDINLPPLDDFIAKLDELSSWIAGADVPQGKASKKSIKFFAILKLRRQLEMHKPDYTKKDLEELACDVLDPVREAQGDDARLRDIVRDVMAEKPLP